MATERDTLCWKCKCCTNPPGTNCPWADRGEPVPGWKADKGKVFYLEVGPRVFKEAQSYTVKECPLFEKAEEFSTMDDVYQAISRDLNITPISAKNNLDRKIERWEQKTGKKMPLWVKNRNSDEIREEN